MEEKQQILIAVIISVILIAIVLYFRNKKCENVSNGEVSLSSKLKLLEGKSETIPVFERHDERPIVLAPKIVEKIILPINFDARTHWPGFITPIFDQGSCGSCWAFSSCAVFSDRIKIATNGADLQPSDYISQYHLAACMKCGAHNENKVCKTVCSGHYMDEVLDYIKKVGGYANSDIKRNSPSNGNQYICFAPRNTQTARKFKAKSSYRVNPYSVGQLLDGVKRAENEYAIMHEIFNHGPVTATIKIFDPMTRERIHQNFYFYTNGVFGTNWSLGDPKDADGYHAISIIGWGEEVQSGKKVKYWIIRNSWGDDWGMKGYGKIVRGENRAIIESDIWTMTY